MSISDPSWPQGYGLVVLDEVDSTMLEAARRTAETDKPTWIFARRQTRGKGRRGRAWADPAGNFAATLSLPVSMPAPQAALRSFIAALAVFDTLSVFSVRPRLALKWPNDVLLDGRKISGILLETSGAGKNVNCLNIGFGINLLSAPPQDTLEPGATSATCLAEATDHDLDPEKLLRHLAFFFEHHDASFRKTGFHGARRTWLQHAAKLGETITARTAGGEYIGTFETIDEAGQLILSTATGRQAIPAADIFF